MSYMTWFIKSFQIKTKCGALDKWSSEARYEEETKMVLVETAEPIIP